MFQENPRNIVSVHHVHHHHLLRHFIAKVLDFNKVMMILIGSLRLQDRF